jgi:hypothetical protein
MDCAYELLDLHPLKCCIRPKAVAKTKRTHYLQTTKIPSDSSIGDQSMKKALILFIFLLVSAVSWSQTNNAYGDNQKQVETGVWAIYSGDLNQDGIIDFIDQIGMDNDVFDYTFGYVVSDLNGDAIVDFLDQIILDNNVAAFIGVVSPLTVGGSQRISNTSQNTISNLENN